MPCMETLAQTIPESRSGSILFAAGYSSSSLKSAKLARFFFPFSKTTLNVSEYKESVPSSTSDTQPDKDLEARHFNIQTVSTDTVFESTISMRPKQDVIGVGLLYRQALFYFSDDTPRVWFDAIIPIERVTNKLRFKEKIKSTGGGPVQELGLDNAPRVGSMTEAFNQANWNYGKINNNHRHETGIADIELRMNWSSSGQSGWCRTSSFIGALFPTGTRINANNAAYVFSPVVGNNHHWGLTYGSVINMRIFENDCHKFRFIYQVNSAILMSNFQVRSFDLKDKQWGRYMEIYANQDAANLASISENPNSGTSGINMFTKCVKVDPRYVSTMSGTFSYQYKDFLVYAGYNFYARHAEKVTLPAWKEHTALKAVTGEGATTLARTIGKNFTGSNIPYSDSIDDPSFVDSLIFFSDLNLDSAAHPGVISQTLFTTLGYTAHVGRHAIFMGLGGSFEFSSANNALERLTGWAILSVTI